MRGYLGEESLDTKFDMNDLSRQSKGRLKVNDTAEGLGYRITNKTWVM